jgi:hypothetical protein
MNTSIITCYCCGTDYPYYDDDDYSLASTYTNNIIEYILMFSNKYKFSYITILFMGKNKDPTV